MTAGRVVALCGGVGGAKLAAGLAALLPPERLTIVVNTGDDFDHFGLRICPDIDTVLYTLSGRADRDRGWGRADESWRFMEAVGELGGETWFNLGDTDLALHAVRTAGLQAGRRLTEVVGDLARRMGLGMAVLPATDGRVATILQTDLGELPLQHYFVKHRCAPAVSGVRFELGAGLAATPEVAAALDPAGLACILFCPSNPYLSIDPILAVPGLRGWIAGAGVPRIAVTPIVAGRALKGPLAKMMGEMGIPPGPEAIVRHYAGLIDCLVADAADAPNAAAAGAAPSGPPRVVHLPTVMRSDADRVALARAVLELAGTTAHDG